MKKIFTLAIGSLLTLAVMAADHKPSVTVTSSKNYKVVVDGRTYTGSNYLNLSHLPAGFHTIKVYEMNRGGFFKKRAQLISAADFRVKNKDVVISIDRFGKMDVDEKGFGFDKNDHGKGWDKQDDYRKGDHKSGRNRKF